jgi:hypothetical protein
MLSFATGRLISTLAFGISSAEPVTCFACAAFLVVTVLGELPAGETR